jgi:hypothetical protein
MGKKVSPCAEEVAVAAKGEKDKIQKMRKRRER